MDLLKNVVALFSDPIPGFFFDVLILDDYDPSNPLAMTAALASLLLGNNPSFSEVSGLDITLNTDTLNEAGWSTPRPYFKNISNSPLSLKRYLRPMHSLTGGTFTSDALSEWCKETVEAAKTWETKITPKDLLIFIYTPAKISLPSPLPSPPSKLPVAAFLVKAAFPTKWGITALSSTEDSQPLIEEIEMKFTELTRLTMEFPL